MSTYVVGWAVGPFQQLSTSLESPLTGKTIKLNAYACAGLIQDMHMALGAAKEALIFFEKLFDIPYALPALSLLAADDFDAGAMENWGRELRF